MAREDSVDPSSSVSKIWEQERMSHLNGLWTHLNDKKYSDFKLRCGNRSWYVHRVILCSRVDYFAKVCDEKIRKGSERVIVLQDDDPAIVLLLLVWIYVCYYFDGSEGNEPMVDWIYRKVSGLRRSEGEEKIDVSGSAPLEVNASVYALADKYSIDGLKDLAEAKFTAELDRWADDIEIPVFVRVVKAIYAKPGTDRGLRDAIKPFLKRHQKRLGHDEEFKTLFSSGLANGKFALDVLDALID